MEKIKIKCNKCNGSGKKDMSNFPYTIRVYYWALNNHSNLECNNCNGKGYFEGEIIKQLLNDN